MLALEKPEAGANYFFPISGVLGPVRAQVLWGDWQSRPWIFEPAEIPQVSSLRVRVIPPDYAGHLAKTLEAPAVIQALSGSRLEFEAGSSRPLREARSYWEAPGSQEESLRVESRGDSSVSWRMAPSVSGRMRLAITDSEGIENSQAWMAAVETVPDHPPVAAILEPAFSEVQMDLEEELAVAWEASDDVALLAVSAALATPDRKFLLERKEIWKPSPAAAPAAGLRDVYSFRPKQWRLKSGDRVGFFWTPWTHFPRGRRPFPAGNF
jgi:hypothetical protein